MRSRSKYASSHFSRSNFGLPSSALPGPVRAYGFGPMNQSEGFCPLPSDQGAQRACSQAQRRMTLWFRSRRKSR